MRLHAVALPVGVVAPVTQQLNAVPRLGGGHAPHRQLPNLPAVLIGLQRAGDCAAAPGVTVPKAWRGAGSGGAGRAAGSLARGLGAVLPPTSHSCGPEDPFWACARAPPLSLRVMLKAVFTIRVQERAKRVLVF